MAGSSGSPYIIAAVDRAIELLLLLEKNQQPMGVTEISKLLGVQKSTAHSLLQTLMARGFVGQTAAGRYGLGARLLQLGIACAERLDVREATRGLLTEIAESTGEIVLLAVLSRDELIIVDKAEPQRPFVVIPKFDFTLAVHSTAVGKALLAHAGPEIYEAVMRRGLQQYTPFTLTDREALERDLVMVRRLGYAVGCNETIDGVTCLAVPIFKAGGEVAAALSVSSVSSILTPDRYDRTVALLRDKAAVISRRLGY